MGSSDGDESDKLIADPDFSSCGTGWLDKDDSCHRWLQIERSVGKMKRMQRAFTNPKSRSFQENHRALKLLTTAVSK